MARISSLTDWPKPLSNLASDSQMVPALYTSEQNRIERDLSGRILEVTVDFIDLTSKGPPRFHPVASFQGPFCAQTLVPPLHLVGPRFPIAKGSGRSE